MLAISHTQGYPPIYRTFLRNRFTLREVVVSPTPLNAMWEGRVDMTNPNFTDGEDLLNLKAHKHASDRAPQNRSRCCGTMQLPEFTVVESKRLQTGACVTQNDLLTTEVVELRKAFK